MKQWNRMSRCLALLLTAAMLLGICPAVFAAPVITVTPSQGKYLISQTEYTLTKGVTESQVFMNDADGSAQVAGFISTIAPDAQVTFKASYNGYYTPDSTVDSRKEAAQNLSSHWNMARTTEQAAAYEKATGNKVLFATNGDYYNMQTLQPLGYLIMEGNLVQTGNGNAQEPYFAVLKDGSYAIRDYGTDYSDVLEAVSGPFYLVKNGEIVVSPEDTYLGPRNAIGLKADGTLTTFIADGRQEPYSVGMTVYETAEVMKGLGCVNALYLDGGGSATFASVHEGESRLTIRNSPSDGPEREVASTLLMISTASSDGKFDHAAIEPNNEVYTPGSTVQFSAIGVDKAGGEAELPNDLNWVVDSAAGVIDRNGLFTAKAGYTGEVTVRLQKGQTVYGSTTIRVEDVDTLYFTGESISLDFDVDSDLGLVAKYAKRSIHYKDGDFDWKLEPANAEAAAFGTMNGNLFHSAKAESTLQGKVTVSYTKQDGTVLTSSIQVEIGKMPVVLQNFEPNENGPLTGAHFHWGKASFHEEGSEYGPGYVGDYPELEVITGGTYSQEIPTTTLLTAPYRFTGNYDTAVPAAPIFHANGYTYYLWPNNSIKSYCAGAVKTTSREGGAQVRSGEYALELDYDYSSFDNSSNSNFYIRYCGDEINIEGYPTQVGVWVYAPEGTPRYNVWADVAVWNGSGYSTKNLKLVHKTVVDGVEQEINSIDWVGWMYCYADLTDLHTSITAEHPMKIRQGEGFLWLSYTPANGEGRYNGTLYFDDYRVVYGTNLDDLINPVIDSISVNGTELAKDGSTTLDTGDVEITATFSDPESQNRSGIDATATAFFIDGVNILADGDENTATTRTTLGNGHHPVRIQSTDGGGNTVEQTREFEVNAKNATNAKVTFGGNGIVTLGGNYEMKLTTTGTVKHVEMTVVDVNTDFGTLTQTAGGASYRAPVVTFADGVEGSFEFVSTGYK